MIVLEVYRENMFPLAVEANLLPLVTMLPRRRDHRFVEVHAADPDIPVPAANRRDDCIAHARAVITERRRQVGREFL